jgi:Uma2 family endonuclease
MPAVASVAVNGESRDEPGVPTTQSVFKFTYEDYRTAPPDKRYELLDGDLVMTPAPNLKHQMVQVQLGERLARFVRENSLGRLFFARCDVVLSDTDVVQPDLLFVSKERAHLLSGGENVQGAPDLVVEILSPTTAERDRGYKRALYAKHGVKEYWLVDPVSETVWIHRLHRGALVVAHTCGRSQTLRSPLLPGFAIDLDDVFTS